jgi:hypothetical protein
VIWYCVQIATINVSERWEVVVGKGTTARSLETREIFVLLWTIPVVSAYTKFKIFGTIVSVHNNNIIDRHCNKIYTCKYLKQNTYIQRRLCCRSGVKGGVIGLDSNP